jgi:hypothetical protein
MPQVVRRGGDQLGRDTRPEERTGCVTSEPVTSLVELSRADRRRLLERVAELGELDREMRQPGTLAATCEPPALHDMARGTESTTS